MKKIPGSVLVIFNLVFILWSSCSSDQNDSNLMNGKTIKSIFIEANGTKWFATENGLSSFDGKAWTNYSAKEGLPKAEVNDLAVSPASDDSVLWVSSTGGVVISHLDGGTFTVESTYNTGNSDLMSDTVYTISPGKAGYIWIGTNRGYNGIRNNEWFKSSDFEITLPVTRIGSSDDGWNYFATLGGGVARNLASVDGITSASSYTNPWAGLPANIIYSLYIEPVSGNQWFGTSLGVSFHQGIETKKNWTVYTTQNGLADNFVLTIAGDADGNIWFGTKKGVSRFGNSTWTSYTKTDGLAGNMVYAIAFDLDGSVWFGTDNGVSHLTAGNWVSYH